MLLEQIKADSLEARKRNSKEPGVHTRRVSLLGTLYAEASRVGKDAANRPSTDEEVLAVVRKFIKNLDETIAVLQKAGKNTAGQLEEKAILEGYLPRQLSSEELRAAIESIVADLGEKSPKAMGEVMKQLKERYGGQFDGKLASEAARTILNR
ncbi:GatB/YqeY domain-containing protein [Gloeobacter kilaueensis]|uniref:GatB/YqeY domain-containing protein n=1 Tax=Gloeobacter kilaueensis (strain ATCC BAA-2537 / CCAP 1431/1 / ULC 316 / JS1) TaxID=1183438 RepID=U5QNE6_GLOK1|nr:GatB/YqeY domain-containing protein [Gloeobacter kilaueensis]AGY60446.1 hypothetical protein GKIL_4200 [Gloeobacter kilaueensis JS1]